MASERILLVEDNAIDRKLTAALLALENYKVSTASSGEEALKLIATFQPQLILTDVRMTGMDGLELTRRLRNMAEWSSIPIVALTGLNSAEDEQSALASGCNAFLSKPVQSQVLIGLVRKHLDGKPAA